MQLLKLFAISMILAPVISLAQSDQLADNRTVTPPKDLIKDEFPKAQAEIQDVLDGIFASIQDRDADKLISYHAYGPKFTEFKGSTYRNGSKDNEAYERGFVDMAVEFDYNLDDLKIAVYGDVAVVTFHADFRPTTADGDKLQVHNQTSLVFVDTKDGWKIVHEHHSPLNIE